MTTNERKTLLHTVVLGAAFIALLSVLPLPVIWLTWGFSADPRALLWWLPIAGLGVSVIALFFACRWVFGICRRVWTGRASARLVEAATPADAPAERAQAATVPHFAGNHAALAAQLVKLGPRWLVRPGRPDAPVAYLDAEDDEAVVALYVDSLSDPMFWIGRALLTGETVARGYTAAEAAAEAEAWADTPAFPHVDTDPITGHMTMVNKLESGELTRTYVVTLDESLTMLLGDGADGTPDTNAGGAK